MKIHDISMAIRPDMAVYKNRAEKRPVFRPSATFVDNGVYETDLAMNLHTGTHIDFPLHAIPGGASSDDHPLALFFGTCRVLDLTAVADRITRKDLAPFAIRAGEFVLLKTRNSAVDAFDPAFVFVAADAAELLIEQRVRGVGIDALGIERAQPGHPTHNLLLGAGIVILEGLRLREVSGGTYGFVCAPLKIDGVEALPVRAVLFEE